MAKQASTDGTKVVLSYDWTEREGKDDAKRHKRGSTVTVPDVTARQLVRGGIGRYPADTNTTTTGQQTPAKKEG